MNNRLAYFIMALITWFIYTISMLLGSTINVLIAYSAGYQDYSQFKQYADGNVSVIIVIIIVVIINHILFSLLTVHLVGNYALKRGCLNSKCFSLCAIVVFIFAAIIYPVVFSSNSGWFTYLVHIIGILLFGRLFISSRTTLGDTFDNVANRNSLDVGNQKVATIETPGYRSEVDIEHKKNATDGVLYCHMCGAKIAVDSTFCNKCGAKIR